MRSSFKIKFFELLNPNSKATKKWLLFKQKKWEYFK